MDAAVGYPVLLRGFELALSVEGLRPHTIRNYVRDVERFAERQGDDRHTLTPADLREYVLELQEKVAPKTVYETQLALRRFFRFLVREGEIELDPTANLKLVRYRVGLVPTVVA